MLTYSYFGEILGCPESRFKNRKISINAEYTEKRGGKISLSALLCALRVIFLPAFSTKIRLRKRYGARKYN